jgi:hypothetical protein
VIGHEEFNDEGRCGAGFQAKENLFYNALSNSLEKHRLNFCTCGFCVFTLKRKRRATQSLQEAFARGFKAKRFSEIGLGICRQKAFGPNHLCNLATRGGKDRSIL